MEGKLPGLRVGVSGKGGAAIGPREMQRETGNRRFPSGDADSSIPGVLLIPSSVPSFTLGSLDLFSSPSSPLSFVVFSGVSVDVLTLLRSFLVWSVCTSER